MTTPFRWVELRAERAEELVRHAGDGDGWALPGDMIDAFGVAVVGAVARRGRVMALAGLTGTPEVVGSSAGRLARAGAALVGVGDLPEEIVRVAVDAAGTHGSEVVVDGTLAVHGQTPGKTAARVARTAAAAGAGTVLVPFAEIGVVADVAPELVVIADVRGAGPEAEAEASQRGARALLVTGP